MGYKHFNESFSCGLGHSTEYDACAVWWSDFFDFFLFIIGSQTSVGLVLAVQVRAAPSVLLQVDSVVSDKTFQTWGKCVFKRVCGRVNYWRHLFCFGAEVHDCMLW